MERQHDSHHRLYTEGYSHVTVNYGKDDESMIRNKINYFQRVKSEEDIDDTLIKYLKNKVKQADLVMKHKNADAEQNFKKAKKNKSKDKSRSSRVDKDNEN